MRIVPALSLTTIFALLGGCGGGGSVDSRDAPTPPPTATPENTIGVAAQFTPNSFLSFLNPQTGLGAGTYRVVVGTATAGATGTFSTRINRDGGPEQNADGAWEAGAQGGRDDPFHAGNPAFEVRLEKAGGLRVEVDSAENAVIFLVRDGRVIARVNEAAAGEQERLVLQSSPIDSRAFSDAYYNTVDPLDQRDTLQGWKQANEFNATAPEDITNAVFRDAKDLGYGRDMFAWEHGCGIAIYEDNYVVQVEEGDASTYGPINLDAAIERNREFLVGSNALEFGPLSGGSCTDQSTWVVKFYTFAPPDGRPDESGQPCPPGQQCRLKEVDFDGRGVKFMPGVCVICHGGTLRPPADGATDFLEIPGDFESAARHVSIKSSSFSVLIPESLEFSSREGFTFEAQRDNVVAINGLVERVFRAQQDTRIDSTEDLGNWSATFALEWLTGIMEEPVAAVSDFVPVGWNEASGAPAGAEALYEQVVEPYCLGCHAVRGSKVAEANGANAVNFSSFEKFMAYRDTTIDYVFRQGVMPLSLITYTKFWEDPVAQALLADTLELPGDDPLRGADGLPQEPGRPVPRPGPTRQLFFPSGDSASRTVELDGSASNFSSTFTWRIVEQAGDATLEDADTAVARLTVTAPGTYRVGLTTSNAEFGSSEEAFADLQFTPDMLDDRKTVFAVPDGQQQNVAIEALFMDAGCADCHNDQQDRFIGLSLYLDRASYADSADLLRAVRARIDFGEPAASRLLAKPLGSVLVHAGSTNGPLFRAAPCSSVADDAACAADPDAEQLKYERFQQVLGWIQAGAPCGGEFEICGFEVPPQPPTAPSDLTVSAARFAAATDQEVDLGWRDNSTDETAFVIERATAEDFADADTIMLPGANAGFDASTTDGDLLASTTYFYRVAAENAGGRSAFSNTVTVTTQAPPPPPSPAFLADSPRALSDTSIQLRWEQPVVTGGVVGETTGFRIERRLDGAELAPIEMQMRGMCTDADPCTFTDTALLPDTAYTYRICALGVPGAMERCSAEGSATTDAEPPGEPTVTLTVLSTTSVRVEWTAPATGGNVDGYRIDRRTGADAFAAVLTGDPCLDSFQCDDTGLDPDTEYSYRVCALGEGGEACSDEATATTTLAPAAPVLAPATVWSDVRIDLAWTAGAGGGTVTNYVVRRGLTPDDGVAVDIDELSGSTFAFEDSGLTDSTTYHYRVCAIGADEALLGDANTACSNQVSATTVDVGGDLWTPTCAGCHGPLATPGPPSAAAFANPATAQYLYDAVRNGRLGMSANLLGGSPGVEPDLEQKARVRSVCRAMGTARGSQAAQVDTSCNVDLP